MAKARSISAAQLTKVTQAAVKAATVGVRGRFVGRGPTMGYILAQRLNAPAQLRLATNITRQVSVKAKAAGVTRLAPRPVLVVRPGKIIAGFFPPELGVTIRR